MKFLKRYRNSIRYWSIKLSIILIPACLLATALFYVGKKMKEVRQCTEKQQEQSQDYLVNPYNIKIQDEHQVKLYNNKRVIYLYFENATVLSEESVVFVKEIPNGR